MRERCFGFKRRAFKFQKEVMVKAETDIPLSPRARETLEKYRTPTVLKRDKTPSIESSLLSKHPKWIDRTGWEQPGDYPIYTITAEGELALQLDALYRKLRDREVEFP
jgi:hypothetical protein